MRGRARDGIADASLSRRVRGNAAQCGTGRTARQGSLKPARHCLTLALFYEFAGYNLAVFWNRHFQMFVSILIDDRDAALRHARSVAERVLERY